MSVKPELVWIDCEMTGLDPAKHVLLEIAIVITDAQGNVVDDGVDIIINQPESVFEDMDDFVTKMHTKSGLLEEVKNSKINLEDAKKMCFDYLRKHFRLAQDLKKIPMCGNSIGMDRRFLSEYMNDLDEALHYRCIDVSTFKEVFRLVKPDAFSNRPDKKTCHRALDDILESIEEYKYYLKFL